MNGTTLLMEKGAIDVPTSQSDSIRIDLDCGGHISIEDSPVDGLRILPSGKIQISGKTFSFTR